MSKKVKDTIPVYDICALTDTRHMQEDIIAEDLAAYLHRHPDLHFPHRHSFYHVVYFTKGSGRHTIDFETFPVKAGQVYFMIPGQVHSWFFKGDIEGYIINFSEQMLHTFLRDGQYLEQFPFFSGIAGDGVIQLKRNKSEVTALFGRIIAEVQSNEVYSMDLVRVSLLALFLHIAREVVPAKPQAMVKQNKVLLQHFRKLVEQYYNTKRLPKEYAAMLYITPNHLNALCNDVLGRPAGELIRDRVLLEAKRLLVSSGISAAEIAWQLNFKDNSYFTKFFKKYTGTTPDEFRKSKGEHH